MLFPTKRVEVQESQNQVSSQLAEGKVIDIMCTSIIKPISGNWIVYTYDFIGNVPDILTNGFVRLVLLVPWTIYYLQFELSNFSIA